MTTPILDNQRRPRLRRNNADNNNSSYDKSNDNDDKGHPTKRNHNSHSHHHHRNQEGRIFKGSCSLGKCMINPCLCFFNAIMSCMQWCRQFYRRKGNNTTTTTMSNSGKKKTTATTPLPFFGIIIVAVIVLISMGSLVSIITRKHQLRIRSFKGRPKTDQHLNRIPVQIQSINFDYFDSIDNNQNQNNQIANTNIDLGGWTYARRFFRPPHQLPHPSIGPPSTAEQLRIDRNLTEPDFGGLINIQRKEDQNKNNNHRKMNGNEYESSLLLPHYHYQNQLQSQSQSMSALPPSRTIHPNDAAIEEKYWTTLRKDDPYLSSSVDYSEAREDKYKKCRQPTWAKAYYPSCNSVHELHLDGNYRATISTTTTSTIVDENSNNDYTDRSNRNTTSSTTTTVVTEVGDPDVPLDTYYLSHGHYRDVWVIHQHTTTLNIKSVIKITRWKHKYTHDTYNNVLADAMVMERLTKSPRIVDIYGHCGTAVWVEAMPNEVEEFIVEGGEEGMVKFEDQEKKMEHKLESLNHYTNERKLTTAIAMAESLADLHGFIDGVIVHDDVQLCQWLETNDGILKLGDFNRAEVMEYNDQKKQYCRYINGGCYGNYRSPEEYKEGELDEGIDVYTFGNNIYALLTGLWVFYSTDDDEVVQTTVKNGTRAYIDPRWRTRSYIESKLVEVMEQCWIHDAKQRIDIYQVVQALHQIKKDNEGDTVAKNEWFASNLQQLSLV